MERNTRQRQAIRQVLLDSDRPLGVQEVLDAARADLPRLGIATVYRTLKELSQEGWLLAVQVPGEAPRYEAIGKGHHHHFLCRVCGRLFDIQRCLGNLRALLPPGFRLEAHDVALQGVCAGCAAGA